MSPRRRLLVVVGAVLVLAATLFTLVRSLGGANAPAAVADPRPGPVVLVPGYGGGTAGLEALATRLRAAGRTATVVHLPDSGLGDLARQADALDAVVQSLLADGAPSIDLVGYSAGGVVVRLWFAQHHGAGKARRIVTLGSPHHGTSIANLALRFAREQCPTACQQLAPESAVLRRLNGGDETPAGPVWTAVYTQDDEVVVPPESGRLQGALDVRLQSVCAGARISHGELPTDPLVQGIVLRALDDLAPIRTLGPADCAGLRASS